MIDLTKIDGYREDMTAEEKLALLDKYEPPKADFTGYVKKEQFDMTASELAKAKKELKAKMTEDEQKEADRAAQEAAIKNELEALRKDKSISEHKAKFLGLGYDEKLAEDTAKALANGDITKVFANQAVFIENVKKVSVASALADDDTPPAGQGTKAATLESLRKMSAQERFEYSQKNPEEYKKIYGGNE